jgi:hypothetical protein
MAKRFIRRSKVISARELESREEELLWRTMGKIVSYNGEVGRKNEMPNTPPNTAALVFKKPRRETSR